MSGFSSGYALARALLFRLPAETAHDLTMAAMPWLHRCSLIAKVAGPPVHDPVSLMGIEFGNRIGMAAGLDKNAAHLPALAAMGFGFVEAGTVTPLAQPGNPKPRMFRLSEQRAIINRMGFNNAGLAQFERNVQQCARDASIGQVLHVNDKRRCTVLGLNIGKNARTPIERAADDYLTGLRGVYPLADYVTVNISSPNTASLRDLQQANELDQMLASLTHERETLAGQFGRRVPLAVKIAPDLDEAQVKTIATALVSHGIDGVIATNTTVSRDAVASSIYSVEAGGLSGAPVAPLANRVIAQLRANLPANFPIIGVGGVMTAQDALAKFQAGANLVQLYSGLIYHGPGLVGDCATAARDYFADPSSAANKDAVAATPL